MSPSSTTPSADVAALRRIRFFEELTDDDLSRLARIGQRRSYAARDAIVEKDSDRGGFFVLLSGEAEVEAGGTVHVLSSGDFFGEMALLAGSRRNGDGPCEGAGPGDGVRADLLPPVPDREPERGGHPPRSARRKAERRPDSARGRSSLDMILLEWWDAAEAAEKPGCEHARRQP